MSRINDLIRQLARKDPELAADLQREVSVLAERRSFGLNFERHVPEAVELPGRPVRRGDKVRILPPRGESPKKGDDGLWRVIGPAPGKEAHLLLGSLDQDEPPIQTASPDDLVVVAEFRDPIYPGLVSTGKIERGGDKPFHTVINAENYHALQALLFTHRGKVDAIYIDPPYNTGAKDWKYNNDYVEGDDLYRHSKWLAFMERRLLLARELLDPQDSILIVTIDEKEYLRLGLLLEQTFTECKIQMVSSVIKPGGTSRTKEFSRVEEYVYFVFVGNVELVRTEDDMLSTARSGARRSSLAESDLWEGMVRRGVGVVRAERPKQFYPIYVDPERRRIVRIGDPLAPDAERPAHQETDGLVATWPIKNDLTEGFWQLSPDGLRNAMEQGTVRVGGFNSKTGQWRVQYMKAAKARLVTTGAVATKGKDENGVLVLDLDGGIEQIEARPTPRTVWNRSSHDASVGGAGMLNRLIPTRKFPFPKSLFAVEDALRFFVGAKPEATVVDFFAGSGTSAHAVMRLNRQDGGHRRSVSVTNNEVSAEEQRGLRKAGCRPGDSSWESHGICEFITKPRITAAVTGETPDGDPIKGDYKSGDEFPMSDGLEENVEFFSLTYEAPLRVATNRDFERIAPLLWLRAGSRGRRIEDVSAGWDVADAYGVLANLDLVEPFLDAVGGNPKVGTAFLVTGEDRLFEAVSRELPDHVEPVRLYESYLRNFEIVTGRSAR